MKKLIFTTIFILLWTNIINAEEITFLGIKLGKTLEEQDPKIEFGELSTAKAWRFPYHSIQNGLPDIGIWYKLAYVEIIDGKIEKLHISLPSWETGKLSRAIAKKYGKPKTTRYYGTTYGGASISSDLETWKLKSGEITLKEKSSADIETGYLDVKTSKYIRLEKQKDKDEEKKIDKLL